MFGVCSEPFYETRSGPSLMKHHLSRGETLLSRIRYDGKERRLLPKKKTSSDEQPLEAANGELRQRVYYTKGILLPKR